MYNMVNTDVICPNCGEGHMIREEPKVIKSNTETYAYLCPFCGFVHTAKSDEDMKEYVKNQDAPICYLEAPQKCLDEKCGHADVFKDRLLCVLHNKWFDLPKDAEDIVNHPSHYETGKFECFDVMREAFGDEAVKNFCICNAFKYLYRHQRKNGIEDIRKAKWYIDHFLGIIDEGLYDE